MEVQGTITKRYKERHDIHAPSVGAPYLHLSFSFDGIQRELCELERHLFFGFKSAIYHMDKLMSIIHIGQDNQLWLRE